MIAAHLFCSCQDFASLQPPFIRATEDCAVFRQEFYKIQSVTPAFSGIAVGTSTAWRKYGIGLGHEGTATIGPFERFRHRSVEIIDEGQDLIPEIIDGCKTAALE